MNRKKLIKLGITVLAINALGAAAAYQYPELVRVPSVYAEEPGEDEEIPDAAEAQAAANFKNQWMCLKQQSMNLIQTMRILQKACNMPLMM
ncbi:hypothetical protein HGP05_04485 [Streptococcus sanguinis]|uniref:Uncharacterized protein n=1 Tax=Streptococcus sanguinis TaxID=1305 RepID=A0A7Y0YRK7_STRSA|nr:hypothetical protein [Streptococcus sanguinis]